jgi:hypothetical protein
LPKVLINTLLDKEVGETQTWSGCGKEEKKFSLESKP